MKSFRRYNVLIILKISPHLNRIYYIKIFEIYTTTGLNELVIVVYIYICLFLILKRTWVNYNALLETNAVVKIK